MYEFVVNVCLDDGKTEVCRGLAAGLSYREALDKVLAYFGEEDVISVELSFVYDSGLVIYKENMSLKELFEEF